MDKNIEMLVNRSVTVFQLQLQYYAMLTVQYTVYVKRSGGRTVRPLRVCFGWE